MDVPTHVHFTDVDAAESLGMAAPDALARLAEKLDDLRSGQVTFAVEQARQSGKLEAMESQLTAMQQTLADVTALRDQVVVLKEKVRSMEAQAFRGWIEKLVAGGIGGGLAAGAQYLLQ